MPHTSAGDGDGLPSTELLQRVKQLALSLGMDQGVIEAALARWVWAYDLDLSRRVDE